MDQPTAVLQCGSSRWSITCQQVSRRCARRHGSSNTVCSIGSRLIGMRCDTLQPAGRGTVRRLCKRHIGRDRRHYRWPWYPRCFADAAFLCPRAVPTRWRWPQDCTGSSRQRTRLGPFNRGQRCRRERAILGSSWFFATSWRESYPYPRTKARWISRPALLKP